jgi:hypothetical protein
MSAIPLLYAVLPDRKPPEPAKLGVCCVLGTEGPSIDRKHAIKTSFTNLDLLRAPNSDRVSLAAWRVLTHSEPAAEGKKRDTFPLMQSSWLVSLETGLVKLDRLGVRRVVIEGMTPSAGWAGYVTTSYKKHGALRAPFNTGDSARWLFELDVVACSDRDKLLHWWQIMRDTRVAGIPRPVMETLDCSVHLMGKHLKLWLEFERWAREKWQSPLYRLLCYLLPSEEEIRGKQD